MAKIFFLLSGEHPTLPVSELKAILEVEGYKFHTLGKLMQVLRLEATVKSLNAVVFRSAMTRIACIEMFTSNASMSEILQKALSTSPEDLIDEGESFAVRVRRVRESSFHISIEELEKKLGKIILDNVNKTKVCLKSPQKTFFGVLSENSFVFGLKVAEIQPTTFVERRPKRKPFFHPTGMTSKMARCMVNLAEPKAGDLVLDPFCGTASMLVEAGLMGCRIMGFDVQRRMVEGSLRNLSHYGLKPDGMVIADARLFPITEADCVVTDPPYGRSATTLGLSTKQIVEDFLSTINGAIRRGRRICIASPSSVAIGQIGERLGYKHLESHYVFVHRTLTREIAVFEVV